ncbi:MAG TPA: serine hydrolase domain-containing protein [Anaeromyxobacteraceae bacterium]|nr:serine hydrolase domain-containing protein [Anaeromyxobacteraceae bacterium]
MTMPTRIAPAALLPLLGLLATATACGGSSAADPEPALQEMVSRKWAAYAESIGYPAAGGAVLYVSTPSRSYFAATGMENASPAIHFRIASNTKTFTAAAIMLLQQRGLLDVDDLVTDPIPGTQTPYVPDTAGYAIPYKGEITIRMLLSHRAGVFDVTNRNIPADAPCPYAGKNYLLTQDLTRQFTFDELVGVVAGCGVSFSTPAQDEYHYSNTGYSLLGKIIERVSGQRYADFVMQNLVVPNGLTATSSPSLATETTLPAPFAVGYSFDYLVPGALVATVADNMSINTAEGNMISTPEQLAAWNRALLTGRAGLDPATVDLMKCTVPAGDANCYGLGFQTFPGLGYGHTGAHNGYLSVMLYDPANDVSLVLFFSLVNFADMGPEGRLLFDIATEARTILGY